MSTTNLSPDTQRDYVLAEQRVLERYEVDAHPREIDVASVSGRARVLVSGSGPPVLMVIGGGMVAGLWAPLMAQLGGHTLYAVELPGHGLTPPVQYDKDTLRNTGVTYLTQVMDGLGIERAPFVGQSIGGLWSTWLALDRPERVAAISYVSCPAAAGHIRALPSAAQHHQTAAGSAEQARSAFPRTSRQDGTDERRGPQR